ncbi:glycoside hydrolase family 5 protein [Fibrobacter sp. UWEL]|uniref:glycoside hydrolase family 5 protein n=1 Tax=Fibrobacter sp. UWEL TaxID=1896209 RepID=UPI000910F1C3|nr:cellulase family glycosylhydrolase [Fibrobacter sp. UWEL]SHK91899.1 endoglucanase [Fibrobacter sp. UWEL]
MIKTKSFFLLILFFAIATSTLNATETFNIRRGINLSEWLEKNEDLDQKESVITTADIDSLKAYNFDHIRIPIREEVLFDESLKVRPEIFNLLKSRIDYCKKVGLKVIIDLHGTRLFSFTNSSNSLFSEPQPIDSFLSIWEKIQELFRDYPTDFLAYECLNEPAAAKDKHHLWNNVLARWIPFIRKTEKNRFLIIGTNRGNQLWTLKFLKYPEDNRLILSIHYYYPFKFTHFHPNDAIAKDYGLKAHYPGKVINDQEYRRIPSSHKKEFDEYREYYDKNKIYEDLKQAILFSKKHNIPLNIGEFGCRRFVDDKDRLQWFRDVTSLLRENGISYTLWGLNGAGFGIKINGVIDKPMLDAIK